MRSLKSNMIYAHKYNVAIIEIFPVHLRDDNTERLLFMEGLYFDLRAQIIDDTGPYTLDDWTNGIGGI